MSCSFILEEENERLRKLTVQQDERINELLKEIAQLEKTTDILFDYVEKHQIPVTKR